MLLQGRRPNGGWISSYTFNGSKITLGGGTPNEVVQRLRELMVSNNQTFEELDLWMTLNMEWLSRSAVGTRRVDLSVFMEACSLDASSGAFTGKLLVSRWLPPFLDSIGFFLSSDPERFTHDTFIGMVKPMVLMADPSFCYRSGDYAALAILLERYNNLRYKPCHLIDEARDWFVSTHTGLCRIAGLNVIDKDNAKLKYNW